MIKIALKNLLRHKRRTILTFSILTVAIVYYIVIQGLLDGFEYESTKNFINLESAHIRITSQKYSEENLEERIKDYREIFEKLKKFNFIKGMCGRLKVIGTLDNGVDEYPVIITGIDPKKDGEVFGVLNYVEGPLKYEGILIGNVIAEKFKVQKGDYLYLNFRDKNGAFVSKEFEIQEILNTPSFLLNNIQVFVNINILQEIGNFKEEFSEIFLLTDNLNNTSNYKNKIAEVLNNYKVTSWQEEGKDYLSISKTKKNFQVFFIFFIILIGVIGTVNTLMIAVFERIREIGTLKAIGMKDEEIMRMFLIEGFLIGLAGSISGIIFGCIINYFLIKYGIDWSPLLPKDINLGYRVLGRVKSNWNISSILISFILGPISTIIASYFPAKKAKNLTPAECLRWI